MLDPTADALFGDADDISSDSEGEGNQGQDQDKPQVNGLDNESQVRITYWDYIYKGEKI